MKQMQKKTHKKPKKVRNRRTTVKRNKGPKRKKTRSKKQIYVINEKDAINHPPFSGVSRNKDLMEPHMV